METEIKFEVRDVEALRGRLAAAGFREETARTHELNELYDFPDRRLQKRGELLRLRSYGARWLLTHKGPGAAPGRHKSREETETPIENGNAVAQMLRALGLEIAFRYEKFRSEWRDGRGDVVVDETPVGTFAEIEGEPAWIDETAQKLGIAPSEYLTCSYAELFLKWKTTSGSGERDMTFQATGCTAPR